MPIRNEKYWDPGWEPPIPPEPVEILGLGEGGTEITTWIAEKGIAGGRIIAANTDEHHLSLQKADKTILIGERILKGRECKNLSECTEAIREKLPEIRADLGGVKVAFIIASLGDYMGLGATPIVADLVKNAGALNIAVVTIPFILKNEKRKEVKNTIKRLAEICDSVFVIDNSKLLEVAGKLPLKEALAVANALIGAFIKNITETITQPSLINLDYADLKEVMGHAGILTIGIGEGEGEDRVEKAIVQALSTPLLDISDISKPQGVLIHIMGGEDLTLEEIAISGELIMEKLPSTKRVIWGAKVDEQLTGKVRVMAAITGISIT